MMAEYVFKISCREEGKGFCSIYFDVSKCFIRAYLCEYKEKLIEEGNYFLDNDNNLIKKNECNEGQRISTIRKFV